MLCRWAIISIMRAVVLYHPQSDHGGVVEDYARDYKRSRGRELELLSLETKEGDNLAKVYDATSYPAVLAIDKDGRLLKLWQGAQLPLMNEIDFYFRE